MSSVENLTEMVEQMAKVLDLVLNEVQNLHLKVDMLTAEMDKMTPKVSVIEERTANKSCAFCLPDQNEENHLSFRCERYRDISARVLRIAELKKCMKCFKAAHGDCSANCKRCFGPHNVLLCNQQHQGFAKRKHDYVKFPKWNRHKTELTDVLQTSSGPIRGKVSWKENDRTVDTYNGIPYAKPPIGKLRFEHFYLTEKSEDCLTLNVLAPRWKNTEFQPSGLPVLVHIHGGAFTIGASSQYHGHSVARTLCTKDVVYLTVNYRIGVFGFFRTIDDTCKGNLGLWDLTMALEWIRDNISAFGGDPNNVCLMGQSAGGACVDLLALSPYSRDLFKRAIVIAGCAENEFAIKTKEAISEHCRDYAKHLGWHGEDTDGAGLIEWMRALDAGKLELGLKPIKNFQHNQTRFLNFGPNYDGDFLPKPIAQLRKEAPPMDILAGVTQNEGLFIAIAGGIPFTINGLKLAIQGQIKEYDYGDKAEDIRQKCFEYFTKDLDWNNKKDVAERIVKALGDNILSVGMLNYANKMASLGSKVHFYCFDYFNPAMFGLLAFKVPYKATTHCMEMRYIVGKGVFAKFRPNMNDLRMVDIMTDYVTNFMKYGTPNSAKTSNWALHDPSNPFRHMRIEIDKQEMSEHFQEERAIFWNTEILPYNKSKQVLETV